MLDLKILSNKLNFTKLNGDVVVDLIRRAVSFLGIRANSGRAYVVEEDTAMRPDLISNYFYNTSNNCDLLLKYNGYSNPFALDKGDLIRVPESDQLLAFGSPKTKLDLGLPRKKNTSIQIKAKTKRDQNRIDYLLSQTGAAAPLPPNIAVDRSVKLVNGKILFGRDVHSITKADCPDPISRTKLISTLIKNKLK